MSNHAKLFSLVAAFALIVAAVPASATTYCPVSSAHVEEFGPYGSGSATPTIILAVAANFAGPFSNLLSTSYTSTHRAVVCSDSTGNFETLIDAAIAGSTALPYTMLFAANEAGATKYTDPHSDYYVSGAISYRYAIGIPALFGYTSGKTYHISSLSDLLTTNDSTNFPVSSNITAAATDLHHYTLSTTITSPNGTTVPSPSLAIADPGVAPYGLMGQNILNDTHPIYGSSYTLPGGASHWSTWLTTPLSTYTNIAAAFEAVGGTVAVGVVAKSQICGLTNIVYTQFSNADFQLDQYAASFTSNDVNTFVQTKMSNGSWTSFLSGACYIGY